MDKNILVETIKTLIDEKKGEHIAVIDLKNKQAFTDFMVIATASSNRQLATIAEYIHIHLKEKGIFSHIEGLPNSDWVLLDAGDVVVHLFKPEARDYYHLEKMWESAESTGAKTKIL